MGRCASRESLVYGDEGEGVGVILVALVVAISRMDCRNG